MSHALFHGATLSNHIKHHEKNNTMASIKVKYRPPATDGKEGRIFYQIIHGRKSRRLPTQYKVFPSEWDDNRSAVAAGGGSGRKAYIAAVRERIRHDLERLSIIIRRLDTTGTDYTASDVTTEFCRHADKYGLLTFTREIIDKLKRNGKTRTSETYRAAHNSFRKFLESPMGQDVAGPFEDIMLDYINTDIMEAYEAWLRQSDVSPNTVSFYMRILRAVYNRAVEEEVIEDRRPFRHVYTGIEKTTKRALPLSAVRKIKSLRLSRWPSLDYARDIFLLSFMLRGMSLIDMAYLRKTDLKEGYVTYRRRKTGQQVAIKWTAEMQAILDKYPENASEYLLPILKDPEGDNRTAYLRASYNINRNLKSIARKADIKMQLTMYVARHSWASGAQSIGIPIGVISEGMGHDSEATTRIYLASLDNTAVDRANARILDSLR